MTVLQLSTMLVPPATRLPPQMPFRSGTCLPPGPATVGVAAAAAGAAACWAEATPANIATEAIAAAVAPSLSAIVTVKILPLGLVYRLGRLNIRRAQRHSQRASPYVAIDLGIII